MELLFVVFLFGLVCGQEDLNKDLLRIDSLKNETPCLSAGGICTVAVDCPENSLAEPGLCPHQQKEGVECCHGLSVKETRCRKRGGECQSLKRISCHPTLIALQATDCEKDFVKVNKLFGYYKIS